MRILPADSGLFNRVVEPEELDAETREQAGRIAAANSLTAGIRKGAYHEQIDRELPSAHEYCEDVVSRNAIADDARVCELSYRRVSRGA